MDVVKLGLLGILGFFISESDGGHHVLRNTFQGLLVLSRNNLQLVNKPCITLATGSLLGICSPLLGLEAVSAVLKDLFAAAGGAMRGLHLFCCFIF
jgi:hypothetical protein